MLLSGSFECKVKRRLADSKEPTMRAENFEASMRDSIACNDYKAIALRILEYEEDFMKGGQNSEMGKIILQTGLDSIYQEGLSMSQEYMFAS